MKRGRTSFFPGKTRGSGFAFSSPGESRAATVAGVVVVVVVLVQQSLMAVDGAAAASAGNGGGGGGGDRAGGRRGAVQDMRCGCGADFSRELTVEPTAESACLPEKTKTPHELRGEGPQSYPLRVKLRRTNEGSQILLNWRLTYVSRKKRSRLSDFHLLLVTKPTRKGKRRGGNIAQCFRVSGLKRACKRKVTCKARYGKSRPRNLSVRVFYEYRQTRAKDDDDNSNNNSKKPHWSVANQGSEGRRRRTVNVLKSSMTRKMKRRGSKRKSGSRKRKNSPRREQRRMREQSGEEELNNCGAWVPVMTISAQEDRVTAKLSPVNPFASGLKLALHYAGSNLIINPVHLPRNQTSYTFKDVTKGEYKVSVLPLGPNCSQARHIYSRDSVNVTGVDSDQDPPRTKRHRQFKECAAWMPLITLEARERSVIAHYSPANHLATELEVALHRDGSTLQRHMARISQNVTTYVFEDVEPGFYRMSIRAIGPECRSAHFIYSRDTATVTEKEPPICSHWKPTFQAREIDHGGWCLIEVDIDTPTNFAGKQIEVALGEEEIGSAAMNIVMSNDIAVGQSKTVFNITKQNGKVYKALVRPLGCQDCKDFELYGEECFLTYFKTDVIAVRGNGDGAPSLVTLRGSDEYRRTLRVGHSTHHHHHHDDEGAANHGHHRFSPLEDYYGRGHRHGCDDCCRRCGCHTASR